MKRSLKNKVHSGKSGNLTKVLAGVALSMAALSAQASTINFESINPDLFGGGQSFSENGYDMTVLDNAGSGIAGAAVVGTNSLVCSIVACPTGNNSTYYAGLNDGGLSVVRGDQAGFVLKSLDFSFIAPSDGLVDFSVGRLVVNGIGMDNATMQTSFEFAPQVNGQFNFSNVVFGGAFGNTAFKQLDVFACLYTSSGSCVNPARNQAQFGLDNINVAAVPEPETYLMMGMGLAGLAALARRRRNQA